MSFSKWFLILLCKNSYFVSSFLHSPILHFLIWMLFFTGENGDYQKEIPLILPNPKLDFLYAHGRTFPTFAKSRFPTPVLQFLPMFFLRTFLL